MSTGRMEAVVILFGRLVTVVKARPGFVMIGSGQANRYLYLLNCLRKDLSQVEGFSFIRSGGFQDENN